MNELTEQDVIKAIQDYIAAADLSELGIEPGCITSGIYAEFMEVSRHTARNHLKKAMRAGLLEPARIKLRNDWGIVQLVAGYRLVQDPPQSPG